MTTTTAHHRRNPDSERARPRNDRISNRLRRAAGQLGGVLTMYEDGRQPTEILDQIAATRAALDAVALLVIDQYAATCTRNATEERDTGRTLADLTTTVRRYLRSR
ncbi:metal-sensitive transcriptional regulator [Actinoplanes sp. NPDC049802]|uniref:metal-sensitive transcriptional regulator n=1 Tax=Actinoplanes sp. NPDC049802 TaxID=3154742 RepID=UPI0033DF6EF7